MAPQFDRALRDIRKAGCVFVRQGKGSHEIWYSPITKRNFPVAVGDREGHTANAILRQAGLPNHFKPRAGRASGGWSAGGGAGSAIAIIFTSPSPPLAA